LKVRKVYILLLFASNLTIKSVEVGGRSEIVGNDLPQETSFCLEVL